ncbi:hypothetical protein LAT59_00030 [Candidatus Gracilibacteria bacterium]|nr:hypothetical protein [Candidatus Gracilibacteria bacterium]
MPLSLGYALLLGYIGLEKGKIIGQGVQGSHFQIVTLIYHILNFVLIPFIIYLSTKGNWGEISSLLAFVIVVGGTSNIILQKYSQIRASYKQLLDIHKDGLRKDNIDISTIMKEHKIPFYYVSYLSYLTVTLSILIFPINTILEFNIFSILYIHISLVSIYVLLSILKNKFPPHVTLRYCGKVKKGFLIEHGKINTVLLMETKTVVIRTDMIESIETI